MPANKKQSMPVYPLKKQHAGNRPPDVRDNLDNRGNIEQRTINNDKHTSNKKHQKNQPKP